MPGVQSFVAQRQQGYQTTSRQMLGAQNRVPVPRTSLENPREKPSFHKPNSLQPADPKVAEEKLDLCGRQPAKVSQSYGDFDTDTEDFEATAIVNVEGCSGGNEDQGYPSIHTKSSLVTGATSDEMPWARLSPQRGQEQQHCVQGSRQIEVEGSEGVDKKWSNGETPDAEEVAESDNGSSISDSILQDLSSPGFSQFILEGTSSANQVAIQPVVTTLMTHSGLPSGDVDQRSQKSAETFTLMGNGIESRAAGPGIGFKDANCAAHERLAKLSSETSGKKIPGTYIKQLFIEAQNAELLDHHESSQLRSMTPRQILRPIRVAQELTIPYAPKQANEERRLSTQKGSIVLGHADAYAIQGSDVDRICDIKPAAPIKCLRILKRVSNLDLSPDELTSMTFEQLSHEPSNVPSYATRVPIPQDLHSSTLVAKMEYVLENLKDGHAKLGQRRAFFTSLSIEQYEECANVIIDKFTALMSKFTDARQQRRRAAKNFEEEVAQREESVRGKLLIVDKDLGRLKRGGEEVVKGAA